MTQEQVASDREAESTHECKLKRKSLTCPTPYLRDIVTSLQNIKLLNVRTYNQNSSTEAPESSRPYLSASQYNEAVERVGRFTVTREPSKKHVSFKQGRFAEYRNNHRRLSDPPNQPLSLSEGIYSLPTSTPPQQPQQTQDTSLRPRTPNHDASQSCTDVKHLVSPNAGILHSSHDGRIVTPWFVVEQEVLSRLPERPSLNSSWSHIVNSSKGRAFTLIKEPRTTTETKRKAKSRFELSKD
jgi:hypothetical protein